MSLNCAMLSADGRLVIPLPQEKSFYSQDTVKLVLDCSENGYPGTSTGYWSSQGLLYLSNRRIVFIPSSPTEQFQSLNIPILHLKNWTLEQPWFGANYIEGIVIPVPGGGLVKNGKLTLTFREGGAIEFTTILQNLMERMSEINEVPSHHEPLPTYHADASTTSSSTMAAPTTYAMPMPMPMPMPPPSVNQDLPPAYNDIQRF
ncbi:unnamed protein product [Absidia cylindrospora]